MIALQKALPLVKTAYLLDITEEKSPHPTPETHPLWTGGYSIKNLDDYVAIVKNLGGSILGPHYKLVTKEFIIKAHDAGLKVVPWTIDHPEDMMKFIEMNVDGIITNDPKLLIKILNKC